MADIFSALATRQNPQNMYFQKLLDEGMNTSPIQSPTQGYSRLAHALLAGLEMYGQNKEAKAAQALRMNLPGLEEPTPAGPSAPADTSGTAPSPIASALAQPVSSMAQKGNRVYSQDEPNPIDAQIFTPQQLSADVPGFVPQQYRPAMGKAAIDQDLPAALLARQTRQESGFNPNAVSSAGAQGISQFMPGTAKDMGINPNDPNQAIPAQAAYLRQNIDKFGGSVPLGLAAYNYGPGNVDKVGGDISRMPAETQNYVRNVGGPQMAQADPAALPPNSIPTSTIPGQPQGQAPTGAAPYQRASFQIEPGMAAQIKRMLASPDAATQQQGLQLYTDERKKMLDQVRSLTDPRERAAKGIQPTDTNPYQVDVHGKVSAVNPQPFAVNVNQQGQSEFEKHYGEAQSKRAVETLDAGDKAANNLQSVHLMRGLMDNIQTGKLTPIGATMGSWLQAAGLDPKVLGINPALPANAEAIASLGNKMALANIGGAGGIPANNFSEADRKFVTTLVPGLAQRPEANDILLSVAERTNQLAMEKADKWAEARANKMSYEDFERAWRKDLGSRNVFGDLVEKSKSFGGATTGGAAPPPASPSIDDLLKKYGPK